MNLCTKFKKLTAVFLSAVLTLALVPADVALAKTSKETARIGTTTVGDITVEKVSSLQDQAMTIQKDGVKTTFASKVPSTKAEFYNQLRKQLLKRPTNLTISFKGSYKTVAPNANYILEQIRLLDDKSTSDDADFLMGTLLYISYNVRYTSKASTFNFYFKYTETANQVKELNKKISSVLTSLGVSKMSPVAKVKAIHDYVVNHVQYDLTMTDHSAYGGLVASKHTTVCQGYALLMYKMLTDAGIPAHYVTGYAGEAHAWNIVQINGTWYYLDATWDDPTGGRPILSHDYFLIGSKKLSKDHTTDSVYTKTYKISANDLDWKKELDNSNVPADDAVNKPQTDQDEQLEQDAMDRNEFVAYINSSLDQELNYNKASEEEQILYDLYKKVFSGVARKVSKNTFTAIVSDDDFFELYIETCGEKLNKQILNPVISYLNSKKFTKDVQNAMLKKYSKKKLKKMSKKQLTTLTESYAMDAFKNYTNNLSKKYTNSIISQCVTYLDSQAK